MAAPTALNGSIQQATPIAVQLNDGTWAAQPGGSTLIPVTITSGTAISPAIDLGLGSATSIGLPAAWTAASMTFQVSNDNATFRNLKNTDDTEYSITVSASGEYPLPPTIFNSYRYLKVRSGTAVSAVNQAGDRIVTVTGRPV